MLELKDERRAMHEGYVFLDEKCLLLAGEILRELAHHGALQRDFVAAWDGRGGRAAGGGRAPRAARPAGLSAARSSATRDVRRTPRSLMGVRLQEAALAAPAHPAPPARRPLARGRSLPPRVRARCSTRRRRSPPLPATSSACRSSTGARCAAHARCRTCCCPELDRDVYEIETRLEELEQEDAIWMRRGR